MLEQTDIQMYLYVGFIAISFMRNYFFPHHILGTKPGKQNYNQILILQNYQNRALTLVLQFILASVIKQHIQELQHVSWSYFQPQIPNFKSSLKDNFHGQPISYLKEHNFWCSLFSGDLILRCLASISILLHKRYNVLHFLLQHSLHSPLLLSR